MATEHHLKIDTVYYCRVLEGSKTFEIRKNDRDYQVGDRLIMREWLPDKGQYCDHSPPINAEIVYFTTYQQQPGYCVLGIKVLGG